MNNILQLKGHFDYKSGDNGFGPPNIPVGKSVKSTHLKEICKELSQILQFWQTNTLIKGALVSVYYYCVIAKSNRISCLLCKGAEDPNDTIRGSKFYGNNPIQHVFTHYVTLDAIRDSIAKLQIASEIVDGDYKGEITQAVISELNKKGSPFAHSKEIAKTTFVKVIVDAFYVQKFDIDMAPEEADEQSIVTIYKTDVKTSDLLQEVGIDHINAKMIDETTIRLNPDEIKLLRAKMPYLIAMKVRDLRDITPEEFQASDSEFVRIPAPQQEPVIGVIDTPFFENVYFKDWVSYTSMLEDGIEVESTDYIHGTEVSSILVDGPTINPELDDGCGRFRVRHFGVAKAGRFSSFSVLKAIREIIPKNQDIKVWNLSLGSTLPIDRNFISPEAAELDKIQSEYDVVFVLAGTNRPRNSPERMAIGAPADSLNSVVVNAVNRCNQAASYYRVGPVLSFFHKPDISYYGGDKGEPMSVCAPGGEGFVAGTSFSAPWIARKLAYLICNLGLTREVAKALLIDAAAGWNGGESASDSIGYGVVPKRIEDIVRTPDDEIRFVMSGSSDAYETYTYNIPVPIHNNKQPFYARATLCYFPKCIRNQGVDYTSTEMDIHFGRVKEKKRKDGSITPTIASINANKQGEEGHYSLFEVEARKIYRKWDNVKLICDELKDHAVPRQVYGTGTWGLSIKTKERLKPKNGRGLQFGVVITLKEMNGVNRIEDFIKLCQVRGWIVNQVDIDNRLDIYNRAEEELKLD